jgi:hypothetical protein
MQKGGLGYVPIVSQLPAYPFQYCGTALTAKKLPDVYQNFPFGKCGIHPQTTNEIS